MKISGQLVSPQFENCSLPLTAMVGGKKVTIGRAYVHEGGRIEADVDKEYEDQILTSLSQVSIKLNPEVRLEPRPVEPRIMSSVVEERGW